LAKDSCGYKYSTARFYELGIKDFDFRASLKTLAFITSTPAPSPEEKGKRSF